MQIAVDTFFLSKRLRHTGTGVYLYNLLSECLRIVESRPCGIEFHGFIPPNDDWSENGLNSPHLRLHRVRAVQSWRSWFFGGMAINTTAIRPDLVFLPNSMGSIPGPFCPWVSTIHDAMPKRLPREMIEVGGMGRCLLWTSAKFARKVITVSEWSKQDLIELYGMVPARVAVTYEGYNRSLYNTLPPDPQASAALLRPFGIRQPYVLHHGMVQLRKNVHRLIQAWDRLHNMSPQLDTQLVLAGPMGLGKEQILQTRESSPNRDRIILTGELPDVDLSLLIKNAFLCVIPSLYEGFCLPLLEAMACGVPTVASNKSCIPEVSGGVLEYFDPSSVEEMAEIIRRGLEDSHLRNHLRRAGLDRAAEFSWERCAHQTIRVLTDACEAGTRAGKV